TTLKRTRLSDYSIVYFATHGLVAGDVKGVGEPSLALSIPAQPTEFDDGLLTSSEVAQLKLNADWVVLSACNTIAGDKPGAEALSGLARSFFYAGAPCAALGCRFGCSHAAHHLDLRSPQGRSESRPRRGAASGHVGLPQRCLLAAQRLPRVLGPVRPDRRRRRPLGQGIFAPQNKWISLLARPFAACFYGPKTARLDAKMCGTSSTLPNKPNLMGSAWQSARCQVIGRRTVAGRLYLEVTARGVLGGKRA